MRILLSTAAAFVSLATAGCSGDISDVSGKVTFKGKPVVYGVVVVVGSDGIPKNGTIQPDGTYRVSGIKAGPAKVAVSSPRPPGAEQNAGKSGGRDSRDGEEERVVHTPTPVDPEIAKNWVALPEKYGDPAKSDLSYTLNAGSNEINLDLK